MNEENKSKLEIRDLSLIAVLLSKDIPYKKIQKDGIFYFIFPSTNRVKELIQKYDDDKLLIEPKKLLNVFKQTKIELFRQKERLIKGCNDEKGVI